MATSRCPQKPFTNKLDIMLKKIIPFVMRYEAAKPFLKPVDHVAYQLPDYPQVIKSPIDLSTIKERLIRKFYETLGKCLQDFNLMLENCYIYNAPDDPIISMGIKLKLYLKAKLVLMPIDEFKVKNLKNKIVPLRSVKTPKQKLKIKNFLNVSQSPVKKISENIVSSNYIPLTDSEYGKCYILINELMSSKYKSINYLFLEPVDVKSLGLSDYHELIKYPIDLSTIQKYMDERLYDSRLAVVNDIYLMINNCNIYNGRQTDIGNICRRFQLEFENLYYSIFKEKCRENVNDEAFYFLMKIKRKHKEIEEMIRINSEKISVSRSRIDMIVNLFENNKELLKKERKRKMMMKLPDVCSSQFDSVSTVKKLKTRLKERSFMLESDVY